MEPLKRILAINDLSGVGKCSLTVMLPVISASGVECSCLPTALLSTHSGGFTGYHVRDLAGDILPMAEHWAREKAVFDGICIGYLANAEQGGQIARAVDRLRSGQTRVVVDPAMADNGRYYAHLGEDVRDAFRRLIVGADIITPNVTEAALLTGAPLENPPYGEAYIHRLLDALASMGPGMVVITSVLNADGEVGNVALDVGRGESCRTFRRPYPGSYHGAGDLFTASLSALLIRGAPLGEAMELAAFLVGESIRRTGERKTESRWGLDFEGALPAYIRRVEEMFGA